MILRFLLVGGIGFAIDLGCTMLLIRAGLSPFLARPPAIVAAMAFTWLANRAFTFNVQQEKSAAEALRYALVALAASLLNYAIYSSLIWMACPAPLAIAAASVIQAGASFVGYRKFAFRVNP